MTLADMRAAVVTNTARSDRATAIDREINSAFRQFANAWPFKALRQTHTASSLAGDLSFNLPTDFLLLDRVLLVNGNQSYQLDVRTKAFFVSHWPNPIAAGAGRPGMGYIDSGVLYFAPKLAQASTFLLHYYRCFPTLVDDTDSSICTALDDAAIALATSRIFASVEQFESAQYWKTEASGIFAMVKDMDQRTNENQEASGTTGRGSGGVDAMLDPFVFRNPNSR